MKEVDTSILKSKCTEENYQKLISLDNHYVLSFIAEIVRLCNPDTIFVKSDSPQDHDYIRKKAITLGEERKLAIEGHTVHFDGYYDQARDKQATKYLLPAGWKLDGTMNSIERTKGLKEIKELLKDIMRGKEMIVCFFGLAPLNSPFFIPALQITDSFYVAHSECILYRSAYESFKTVKGKGGFFRFVHSAGELEGAVSKNIDRRRIYIDLKEEITYSVNTQYAGNTLGLKKLALRLAIQKASREGWLAEHMFVTGIKGGGRRVTYFCGAYPSACGKTSTAMLEGESIIGDDIAYLRIIENEVRAVNVESGIFGIIRDVEESTDPIIWKALTTPGEVIFSNVLISPDGVPYWLGDGREHPPRGINFSGDWYRGKLDEANNEIPCAHKNARYTVALRKLENCDPNLDDPLGVEVGGIIYGGRDSDTWPPVQESFDWVHGVLTMGASLESETTAATLGKEGVRTFNLMSNLDFLSIPMGTYISNYIQFGKKLKKLPRIFSVNYFLRDKEGRYLNDIEDKRAWLKWMERRVHNEVEAIKTPTGLIPYYEDLKEIFSRYLNKTYSRDDYSLQFTLRVPENIAKMERIINIYRKSALGCPQILFRVLKDQIERLESFRKKYGDYVDPFEMEKINNDS